MNIDELIPIISQNITNYLQHSTGQTMNISDQKIRETLLNINDDNIEINPMGIYNHYTQTYDKTSSIQLKKEYYIKTATSTILDKINTKLYNDYLPIMFDAWKIKVNYERPVRLRDGDSNNKLKDKRLEGTGQISIPRRI